MTNKAEFDRYADEYRSAHARNIRVTGEGPEYFARYKVDLLGRLCRQYAFAPELIVDFGTGLGASLPHLESGFPQARIVGTDVSAHSLDYARRFESARVAVVHQGGPDIPLADGMADIVFVACVLHHVPPAERPALLRQLTRKLRPAGWICVFEHNPWNPLTRRAVSTCMLDTNARLLPQQATVELLTGAGLRILAKRFTVFFPHALRALRALEEHLGWLPLGGQYMVLAELPGGDSPGRDRR